MSAGLHPHPEARFQTVEQMQAHMREIFMRQKGQAQRLLERQREIDAIEKAKQDALDRLNVQAQDLAKARAAQQALEAAHDPEPPSVDRQSSLKAKARVRAYEAKGPRELQDIVHKAAIAHGVTFKDIMELDRSKRTIRARFAAVAAVREARPSWSYTQLGIFFDRDHTSILNALRVHARTTGAPDPKDVAEHDRVQRQNEFLRQVSMGTAVGSRCAKDENMRRRLRSDGLVVYRHKFWFLTEAGRALLRAQGGEG